ncbi:hypothetical protein [Clostridium sp. JN-1]|uniref:hypothetical protein n=1 Tax=Clostridium sp. JN-1 TaxID=2483110 RepID=UPI000F0BB02B|nr:hypothetical protein [Clostridium sp. JN-1]
MSYSKENIVDFISESITLKNIFSKSADELKELFLDLIGKTITCSDNKTGKSGLYAKEMKETSFRYSKIYLDAKGRKLQNYCMYTLSPAKNCIYVDLRTDGIGIQSEILDLINRGNCYNGGYEWYRFAIRKRDEIDEAERLIRFVYTK